MKDIKKKIMDSITYTREQLGFTLISENWGEASYKCACAIGCVLINDKPKDMVRIENDKERYLVAAEILEVNEQWIDCFIEGFDYFSEEEGDSGFAKNSINPEAWELGWTIAKETKPIPYHLWDGNPT